ncbi:NADPH:quinone reductase [Streptomyces aurantiacus]|uniref:NADPH:quinone reductase n=1 Tax=Streptomyces aurantiacus TaxID=47760 RepID=UPI0006E15351|nr:NADPH:quinone reductase [Streptomyces aurantiacus]
MYAAWYDTSGPARDVLQTGHLPTPTPHEGEVLVQVKASGINPSDYKRRGAAQVPSESRVRTVPHSDGSGVVVEVGDGVDPSWVGRSVWMWNAVNRNGYAAPQPREWGTAAEFVALPVTCVSALPDGTSFATGACLGVPAFTAYAAVFAEGPVKGRTVLVQGGAGAVGELAVQFAAQAGATVIATVSSDGKAQRARDAGAHHVVNYRERDVVAAVRAVAPTGVDRVIEVDFAANIRADAEMIQPYGVIASYSSTSAPEPPLPYYALQYKGVSIRTIQVFTMPASLRTAAVEAITTNLKNRTLRPTIAASFPLDRIAQAHELAESRPNGNVVLSL